MKRARRAFTPEFKQEAVRQIAEVGRPVSQVARDLDLRPEQRHTWRKQLAAAGDVPPPAETLAEENRRLRRELAVLRQEHEFLGKAAVDSSGQCNTLVDIPSSEVGHGKDRATGIAVGQAPASVGAA